MISRAGIEPLKPLAGSALTPSPVFRNRAIIAYNFDREINLPAQEARTTTTTTHTPFGQSIEWGCFVLLAGISRRLDRDLLICWELQPIGGESEPLMNSLFVNWIGTNRGVVKRMWFNA
jgi:hypothetical protein